MIVALRAIATDIVLIGARDPIDGEELQRCFDKCIGIGDESNFPTLKLSKLMFTDE